LRPRAVEQRIHQVDGSAAAIWAASITAAGALIVMEADTSPIGMPRKSVSISSKLSTATPALVACAEAGELAHRHRREERVALTSNRHRARV